MRGTSNNIKFVKKGEIIKGSIQNIKDNVAYVKINNFQTAVLYKEDICNVNVNNINEKLSIGDTIKAYVKRCDYNTGKIVLSTREFYSNNFDSNNYYIGQIVSGIIRNRYKNCVFVEIGPNLVGLANYKNCVSYGQNVEVKIKKIDNETQKIKLEILG